MTLEHTERQSSDAQRRAKDLSLRSTVPPIEVPGYETQKFLGSGAFGEVWTGIDQNTNRRVAIKFYTHRGGVDWTLLSREVEKLAVLAADRYVVQLLDVGWDSEPPYYVMDYIENGSLEDLLEREGNLPLSDAVEIFQEVAVGMMHLHGKGVLHCDLKPANVLLDEDEKPRLADFGQSRLSHEQKPALGTLFYMAPEQADLEAVPDARWDVYALGALFHCMLTGEPPFKTGDLISGIDSTANLAARLKAYRDGIKAAPPAKEHRNVPGIDRSLIEVIDRCLAVDPDKRYPSVQSVIDALRAREEARMRTPLLLFGIAAPIILLVIMMLFGYLGYRNAVKNSRDEISYRAQVNNDTYATSVARAIEAEIPRYFHAVEQESQRQKFRELFEQARTNPILDTLNVPKADAGKVSADIEKFAADPDRIALKAYFQQRVSEYLKHSEEYERDKSESMDGQDLGAPPLQFASVFATDANGTIFGVGYDDPDTPPKSQGQNYSYRTYFHGQADDLPKTTRPDTVTPITDTHLSTVFRSTSTNTWKIAFSTPIYGEKPNGLTENGNGKEFLGVMVMTIHLGKFSAFRDQDPNHFAVLVDNREGDSRGMILQHHFYNPPQDGGEEAAEAHRKKLEEPLKWNLDKFKSKKKGEPFPIDDPIGELGGVKAYQGKWIAAIDWVHLPKRTTIDDVDEESTKSELAVIVQENQEETLKPVQKLGNDLLLRALLAAVVFFLVVSVQWYFVIRMLGGLKRVAARYSNDRSTASDSLHNMETITAPESEAT